MTCTFCGVTCVLQSFSWVCPECSAPFPMKLPDSKFSLGDLVTKTKGSEWTGRVVGYYSTALTPVGVCVESSTHKGSVQIYPESALKLVE